MSQINSYSPMGPMGPQSTTSGFSQMSSEDFIRVIFTELANQDPLSPNDSAALLDQLNSIRSIESDMELMSKLSSLVFENQLSSASGMIGKFVGGLTDDGIRVGGHVLSVVRQGGEVALELDSGWFLPLDGIETIIDPALFETITEAMAMVTVTVMAMVTAMVTVTVMVTVKAMAMVTVTVKVKVMVMATVRTGIRPDRSAQILRSNPARLGSNRNLHASRDGWAPAC